MKKLILGILLVCTTGRSTATSSSNNPLGCLRADILFVTDWSGNLKGYETTMAGAIRGFTESFTLAPDGVKVGIVSFSSVLIQYANITDNSTTIQFATSALGTTLAFGGSTLHPALQAAPALFAASQAERTADALRFIIIITDGELDDRFFCRDLADELKQQGIIICVIGMGSITAHSDEFLNYMASPGYMFYSGYAGIAETLLALDICA